MAPEPDTGALFSEPVLVVPRTGERLADGGEHHVRDQRGRRLATVRRAGGTRLEMVDAVGQVLLALSPPAPSGVVTDAAGAEVGRIVREDVFGRTRLVLRSGGRHRGSIHAGDLRGWNFAVLDQSGAEIARITRSCEGLPEAIVLTPRDQILQIRRPVRHPLRALVVAAVLTVDGCTAHQAS